MKRFLSVLLAIPVVFFLASCTVEKEADGSANNENNRNQVTFSDSYEETKIASSSSSQILMSDINSLMSKKVTQKEDKISLEELEKFYFYSNKKGNYLSYEVLSDSIGFGGHPNYTLRYYVVDEKRKELVNEEELFNDKKEAIDFIVMEMAKKSVELKDNLSLFNMQILEGDFTAEDARVVFLMEDKNNLNFTFNDKGMIISYNPSEIAPYAIGQIDYTIPYEMLKPYLKQGVIKNMGL